MKIIQLTKGKVTIVDDEDFDLINSYKWKVSKSHSNINYAIRNAWDGKQKKYRKESIHRVIMGVTNSNIFIDHIDGDGLNNCKSNLRICTHSQNACNRKSAIGSSSQYLGVSLIKSTGKWLALIRKDKRLYYLGVFNIEAHAALAYNKAAQKFHGEFASLNKVPNFFKETFENILD